MIDNSAADSRGRSVGRSVVKHRAPARGPVAALLRQGTRRRLSYGLTMLTVLALLGGTAIAVGLRQPFRMGDTSQAAHGVGQLSATADVESAPPAPARGVPATPEGILELLGQLVRPMKTSNEAKNAAGGLLVQAYLDDGTGPGMIRLGIRPAPAAAGGDAVTATPCRPSTEPQRTCQTLPNGAKVMIISTLDNCAQRTAVSVLHPDGMGVAIDVASCLEFDGTTNPAGRTALSADQAVALAADPRWERATDPEVVAAGRRRFPTLRRAALPDVGEAPASDPAAASAAVPDGDVQWEDVNGDSADDYCRRVGANRRSGQVACTLSTGTGFGRTITSSEVDWGPAAGRDWEDFDGDNRVDFCRRVGASDGSRGQVACTLSVGTGFGETITSAELDVGSDIGWSWADVNSDNKADYCRRLIRGGTTGRLACTLSTGSGFGDTLTSPETDLGQDIGWEWEDVSGDDKSDYCRRLSSPSGATGRVACTLSTGTGFGVTVTSAALDVGADSGQDWEDVNGDDKSDYCRRLSPRSGATGRVACTLSTGTGFGATFTSAELDLGADAGVAWEDANSDERADYCRRVGRAPQSSHVACTLSTGTGFGATIVSSVLDWGRDVGVRWVDLNADQKKDYCRRTGATRGTDSRLACTLSTGTGFGRTVISPVLDWGIDD